jgi:hypothetical protein
VCCICLKIRVQQCYKSAFTMSNDFRSLLATFEAATGSTPTPKPPRPSSPNGNKPKKTLIDLTTRLWNYSQIRQSAAAMLPRPPIDSKQPVHVAICLCVIDHLPHERVWEYWCGQGNARISAELYLHAKHPNQIRSDYARSKMLKISHNPNWNDVRVVHAMLGLVEEALKNAKVTHIIFGTESCLPICPLHEVELKIGSSYVQSYGKEHCSRFDERDVWDVLKQYVPLQAIHKAIPGWCCLCRSHAQSILDLPKDHLEGQQLYDAFIDCWAPEEAFFPTALALLGLLVETENKPLTYAEWNDRARNHQGRAHPREWDSQFGRDLVHQIRQDHECIILRKVKREVPLRAWIAAIERKVITASPKAIGGTKRAAEEDGGESGPIIQRPKPASSV